METTLVGYTFDQRLNALRAAKLQQTLEKQRVLGSMDHDDHALILPPPERRKLVQAMSSSGMPITDCLLDGFEVVSNHPSGGFFGPRACGENFGRLLRIHPVYIDPVSSLAGGYMVNFMSYRKPHWNPDFALDAFRSDIERYKLLPGIGAAQHFCQDLEIGLDLGWGGILENIRWHARRAGAEKADFYTGLEAIVTGEQDWIARSAAQAREMAVVEADPQIRANLEEIAEMNQWLVAKPARSFREACQWILWYQTMARMYNGSGSLGRLDVLLEPFYESDRAAGILEDEEAIFHIACLLVRDTAYIQLGGPDADGRDVTGPVSYLILEAGHRLRIPANVGVAVGDEVDPNLLRRAVEIQFEDKAGYPKFLGVDRTTEGFTRSGFPPELGRLRAYSGCHWLALPGREYTMNDCVKINLARILEVALAEMLADPQVQPSSADLYRRFDGHLRRAIDVTAQCMDFHIEHMHDVMPELVLDLLCYGPIERGEDASHGGVEFTNLGIDGAALAVVADSLAAIEQRIEREGRLTWAELKRHLESNWSGLEGERARLLMHSTPRYGSGGSLADEYAVRVARLFAEMVASKPTPNGHKLIPGLFSWANTIPMGKDVGATPNGRRAGEPISHGSNPEPGFRRDGAPTAMAVAVAAVQPGYGNTAPMQVELDPMISREQGGVELIASLIRAHFRLGGTQINMNIMDRARVLEAHKDPSKFPDLVVRVTGFSAYFASLSPAFRQLVVDRIMAEGLN
jgi:formate C-acetyltransferase